MRNQFLLIIAIVLLGASLGLYLRGNSPKDPVETEIPIAATYEGKIVYPFGSSVTKEAFASHCEREGGVFNACGTQCAPGAEMCTAVCAFTCEFPKAPVISPQTSSVIVTPQRAASLEGVRITFVSLLEDSRCPEDVVCIQAGRLRAQFDVGTSTQKRLVLSTDADVAFGTSTLRIKEVRPPSNSTKEIAIRDYEFLIEVK